MKILYSNKEAETIFNNCHTGQEVLKAYERMTEGYDWIGARLGFKIAELMEERLLYLYTIYQD